MHLPVQKLGVLGGDGRVIFPFERPPGFGKGSQHQPIPGGQHFVIQARWDALGAGGEQFLFEGGDFGFEYGRFYPHFLRHHFRLAGDMQNVDLLPIAMLRHAKVGHEQVGVVTQMFADLHGRPHIKFALFPFTVGVIAAVKTAAGVPHFARHKIQCLLDDAPVKGFAGDLPGVQIDPRQQRIVVKHLFKVGHQPVDIGGVASKTAA